MTDRIFDTNALLETTAMRSPPRSAQQEAHQGIEALARYSTRCWRLLEVSLTQPRRCCRQRARPSSCQATELSSEDR